MNNKKYDGDFIMKVRESLKVNVSVGHVVIRQEERTQRESIVYCMCWQRNDGWVQ